MKTSAVSTITKSLPITLPVLVNYSLLATLGYINLFAQKTLKDAIATASKLNEPEKSALLAYCYHYEGFIFQSQSKWQESLNSYYKAVSHAELMPERDEYLMLLTALATCSRRWATVRMLKNISRKHWQKTIRKIRPSAPRSLSPMPICSWTKIRSGPLI